MRTIGSYVLDPHRKKIEGLETGADDYIKPFSDKELQTRIHNLIRNRKLLRQKFSTSILLRPEEMEITSKDKVFILRLMKITEKKPPKPAVWR